MRDSLLLTAAVLAAFGLCLAGSFHFDDYALFENAALTAWTATRPLTNLTFWLNEQVGGQAPFGYHLVNLLLHLGAVLFLRSALGRVLPPRAALTAALVFAVHPLAAEPVNYVFARGTLLATLLVIVSLRSWLIGRNWEAMAWFGAALLAKEECVAFPLFLLLLHLAISRNRRELPPILAMLALSASAGLRTLTATAQIAGAGAGFTARLGPLKYCSTEGVAILRYLRQTVVPWGFTIDPDLHLPSMWIRLAAWIAILALAALALRWFSRARAGFWFIGALVLLLPSSSIFPADDLAADRRMYLPMVALSAGLGLLLSRADRRIAVAVLCVFTTISIRYSYVWQTEQRLWSEAVTQSPSKARPRLQLSRCAANPLESLRILGEAQSIAPGDASIASEQGRMLLALSRPAEALAAFGRALALEPNDPVALSNRGVALAALGQTGAARQDFERALARNPCLFDARLNLKRTGGRPPAADCLYTRAQQEELAR